MEVCLRAYTQKFIGLDCLGMVSNCANAIYGDHGLYRSPQTIPNKTTRGSTGYGVLSMLGDRISSAADIKPYMGMIYAVNNLPGKHGVIIDVATPIEKIWKLQVIESLGQGAVTGPRESRFEVDRAAKGPIFTVRRKTPFLSTEQVFIVRYHG